MDFTPEELRLLAGPEFNKILADDPELKRLEQQRDEPFAQILLADVLSLNPVRMLGNLPLRPLTAAKWAWLRTIGNAFAVNGPCEDPAAEADVFLFVCSHEVRDFSFDRTAMREAARDFVPATGLPLTDVFTGICKIIRDTFAPLSMLISTDPPGPVMAPWEWLICICSIAARETMTPVAEIMHKMPLSAVFACYVNYRRRESNDKVIPLTDSDYEEKISSRINELSKNFLSHSRPQ